MMTVVMSGEYPPFVRAIERRGFHVQRTKPAHVFYRPEQYHADMQLLRIRDRVFTWDRCQSQIGASYPGNVRLNCLLLGNRLYGKLSAVDEGVLRCCREYGIALVNVNQGYTRCSTLVVNDRAIITADSSIERAVRESGAEVLKISSGHIRLKGYDYGFIGGASATVGERIFFFGNITAHPDYTGIRDFIENHHSYLEILCEELPLTDIGGAVLL